MLPKDQVSVTPRWLREVYPGLLFTNEKLPPPPNLAILQTIGVENSIVERVIHGNNLFFTLSFFFLIIIHSLCERREGVEPYLYCFVQQQQYRSVIRYIQYWRRGKITSKLYIFFVSFQVLCFCNLPRCVLVSIDFYTWKTTLVRNSQFSWY